MGEAVVLKLRLELFFFLFVFLSSLGSGLGLHLQSSVITCENIAAKVCLES